MHAPDSTPSPDTALAGTHLAFIGGGNMASAIIGGLVRQGLPATRIDVLEPHPPQRDKLRTDWGVNILAAPGPELKRASLVVWAVKPQIMRDAALGCAAHTGAALHLSVAAGIRSDSLARWLGTDRIVRAMPNTPALVGLGMTGLYARPSVGSADRLQVEAVLRPTGRCLWLPSEPDLDAVTALSGSGPAYVFYFLEAMRRAGTEMGLDAATATQLAIGTFVGASQLAQASPEPPEVLRERVTSKGGTTYAALTAMDSSGIADAFVLAMHAAQQRARELGDAFGA